MFNAGVALPVSNTPGWDGLLMSLPENQMDPATEESTIDSPSRSDKRKRQRGISPVSRLQRPRIELESGLDALHAIPQENQKNSKHSE